MQTFFLDTHLVNQEDFFTTVHLLYYAENIYTLPLEGYGYYCRSDSSSRNFCFSKAEQLIKTIIDFGAAHNGAAAFFKAKGLYDHYEDALYRYHLPFYKNILLKVSSLPSDEFVRCLPYLQESFPFHRHQLKIQHKLHQKASGAKIINFEDDGDGIYHADLVFNALYSKEMAPHIKAGEKYYIPGRLFMFYEPVAVCSDVRHVFIGFGGADPQNYTDRLLNIICKEKYNRCQFTVVLGRAKENIPVLLEYNKFSNISVLYDVKNMPEIMSHCDIGFTSRGRTGYELAMLGIPTIAMAQNKREEKHGFVSHENGFNYLGLNPPDSVIESNLDLYLGLSREDRQVIQNRLLAHDFRKGRNRVMNLIYGL